LVRSLGRGIASPGMGSDIPRISDAAAWQKVQVAFTCYPCPREDRVRKYNSTRDRVEHRLENVETDRLEG
jgi:hypothetical protein